MATPRALDPQSPRHQLRRRDRRRLDSRRREGRNPSRRRLLESPGQIETYQILTIPGGFSYGDDLGAGRIFAARIGSVLTEAITRFHDRGGLTLGICNGFQVLVRGGLLPGGQLRGPITLCRNDHGRFEDRWVRLAVDSSRSLFLDGNGPIELPIAHGEGRFLAAEFEDVETLKKGRQIATSVYQ